MIELKKRSGYHMWFFKDGNTCVESELLNNKEFRPILESLNAEVLGALNNDDYEWWIESIKDEVLRAGYILSKENEE